MKTNTNSSLDDSDIPWASLPIELYNVVQPKRLLLCNGACTAGKKIKIEIYTLAVNRVSNTFRAV